MRDKCLLVKTKDNRKFLTYQKNLPSLIEYAKTFHAEIFYARPNEGATVYDLKSLTAVLCSADYPGDPDCKQFRRLIPKTVRNRKKILSDASKIRSFIQEQFLAGQPVSLKQLKAKYKKQKLTDACLCNHMSVVRKQLATEGHNFRKIGQGKYCLAK